MTENIADLCNRIFKGNNGRYRLLEVVAVTNMSAVYRGRNLKNNKSVAVKVLLSGRFGNKKTDKRRLRFQREAIVGSDLRHTNIVRVLDYFEEENVAFIVMPYYEKGTLRKLINAGPISLKKTVQYIKQIAPALDFAHGQGIIHRDIKPDNFLRDDTDHLMLSDFGIAHIDYPNWESLTTSDKGIGTITYMSPEAINNDVDYRTDIYALGLVIYEMLNGELPFAHKDAFSIGDWHRSNELPSLHRQIPGIPAAVDQVLHQATAKDRSRRFYSARKLAEALALACEAPLYGRKRPSAPPKPEPDLLLNQGRGRSRGYFSGETLSSRFPYRAIPKNQALNQQESLLSSRSFIRSNSIFLSILLGFTIIMAIFLGAYFLLNQPSSPVTYPGSQFNSWSSSGDADQAKTIVTEYYADWNKGDYIAAYNLLNKDYQNKHPYTLADYSDVRYSCLKIHKTFSLSDGDFQIDVTVDQIQGGSSGSDPPVKEYTLSFVAQDVQDKWDIMPENLKDVVPAQETCKEP